MTGSHAGITGDLPLILESLALDLTGVLDSLADRRRNFFSALTRDIAILDGGNFNVEIDSIEQRAGNALTIALHLCRAAPALAFQIAEVAALAGIHRRNEHKLTRKCYATRGARDRD